MEISDVRIKMIGDSNSRLRAFCTITFDGDFVVRDLKIVDGVNGLFVAMPSRKIMVSCGKCRHKNQIGSSFCNECGGRLRRDETPADTDGRTRLHRDIAHPINTPFREKMQSQVIEAFREECERSAEPGYEPPDDSVEADAELDDDDHHDDADERIGDTDERASGADEYAYDAEERAGDVDDRADDDADNDDFAAGIDDEVSDVDIDTDEVDDHDDDVIDNEVGDDDADNDATDDVEFDDHRGLDEYGSLIADLDRGEGAPDRGGSHDRRGRPEPSRAEPSRTDGDGRDRSRGGGSRGGRGRRGRGQRGQRQTEQAKPAEERGRAGPPQETTRETTVASTDAPPAKRSDSGGETKRVESPRDKKTEDAPAPSQRTGRSRGRAPRTAAPSDPPQRDRIALSEVAEEPPPVEDNPDESGEFGCGIL